VRRIVHHQVPPKVEYELTGWGQDLCPALDALLTWAEKRPEAASRGRGRAINEPSQPGER
jgi:DNA-binding HxlR family transcriptional regulator